MKVVIIEDEIAASENLCYLLNSINPDIEIEKVLDSVSVAVEYLKDDVKADLIFMDIHLADGISFEIFEKVEVKIPVVFTTAYDQYAIKAFKVNSVDYLLKPIDEEELGNALQKFKILTSAKPTFDENQLSGLLSLIKKTDQTVSYKESYLVRHRDELIPVKVADIAYFYIDLGLVKAVTLSNKTYTIDRKLEEIESELNPKKYYRINRQYIANKESIQNIKYYFNGKLMVALNPKTTEKIIVSKAKATSFKNWITS